MKRIISLVLIAMLCVSLFAMSASAVSATASLTGPSVIRAGDTITLSFNLNAKGIFGAEGTLSYNSSQLTLVGTTQKIGSPWVVEFNGNIFAAYDNNLTNPINSNVSLFTVTFKVNAGVRLAHLSRYPTTVLSPLTALRRSPSAPLHTPPPLPHLWPPTTA